MNLESVVRSRDRIEPERETVIDSPDDLQLLAHPLRQEILHHLTQQEMTTRQLAEAIGVELNNIYHHLERLVEGGIIAVSREADLGKMTVRHYRALAERVVVDLELPRQEA